MDGLEAAWWPSAAYLYILHADGLALAWEYMRRNTSYRADWARRRQLGPERARHWGLRFLENPSFDSRDAEVHWMPLPAACVRLTRAHDSNAVHRFCLREIPGRRTLFLENGNLWLTIRYGHCTRLAYLSPELSDGDNCGFLVPIGEDTPQHRHARSAFAACLSAGGRAAPPTPRRPSATNLFHMRALQALDADFAGAAHRHIAAALFGEDTVLRDWHTDGYLRAQVRHMLRRAHALTDGGYRDLLHPRRLR